MTIILYVCIAVNLFSCYLNYQLRKQLLQRLAEAKRLTDCLKQEAKRLTDCLKQIDRLEKTRFETERAGTASNN